DVRDRRGRPPPDRGGRPPSLRLAARGHHPRPRPAQAHLPPDRRLRALRALGQGVLVGAPQPPGRREAGAEPLVAKVLADVAALAPRPFDYVAPDALRADVRIGSVVRVPLQGRRVRGWVVGLSDRADTERRLMPIARISSAGPSADVLALAEW